MNKKPYAIFMDIDGTLLNSNHEIEPKTLETLRYLEKQGHQLFIATGRMYFFAQKMANKISNATNFIASNGAIAKIYDQIITNPLSIDSSLQMYKIAKKTQLPLFFFSQTNVYYTDILPVYFNDDDRERIGDEKQRKLIKINTVTELENISEPLLNGIIISENNAQKLQLASEKLMQFENLAVSSSASNNIELTQININKATAIHQALSSLEIPRQRTIAFGDGNNDIEMLKYVQHGIAMENAPMSVKNIASAITTSNNEEGIHKFLTNFFKL
jgi:HAD-superfamily hydrolase, subfamily IIB